MTMRVIWVKRLTYVRHDTGVQQWIPYREK